MLIPPISLIAYVFEPALSRTSQSELKTTSRPHPWESVDSQPAPQTMTSESLLLPDSGTLIDRRDSQTKSWISCGKMIGVVMWVAGMLSASCSCPFFGGSA